jgi:tRNA(Glu) U13 pseudouridine synthase TruD
MMKNEKQQGEQQIVHIQKRGWDTPEIIKKLIML